MTFRKIKTGDKNIDEIQQNVLDEFQNILIKPFQAGTIIENISITTSTTKVSHGLKRKPQGFVVIDIQGDSNIWRTSWDDNFITFDCSSNVTASIYIF